MQSRSQKTNKSRVGSFFTGTLTGGPPIAGKLVVWRDLRILRSFPADQVFWSWAFEHDTAQIAYHVGPAHGETVSHCELHDLRTGRLLSSWDGDLDTSGRPAWTKQLNH